MKHYDDIDIDAYHDAMSQLPRATVHYDADRDALAAKALRPPDIRDQVQAFCEAFGIPIATRPALLRPDRLRLRLSLIIEEFAELLAAARGHRDTDTTSIREFVVAVCDVVLDDPGPFDMVGVVDALADLDYVVEGMRLELGVNGRPVAAAVHAANMAKVGGSHSALGKIQKPPGWCPPDIEDELRAQGWTPPDATPTPITGAR